MKIAFFTSIVLTIAGGCSTNKKPEPLMSAHNNVTDITPSSNSITPMPAATPLSRHARLDGSDHL